MERDLRELIVTVQEPHLRALLERVLGEGSRAVGRLPDGARREVLPPGLPPRAAGALPRGGAGGERDLGDLPRDRPRRGGHGRAAARHRQARGLHGGRPQSSTSPTSGRLHGEIALGYYRIRREIEEIEGFPEQLAWAVLHIILSHHGSLEHGSPVVPCTREATLVHMIDNLGGRLGSFDRLEKELAPGRHWSELDRALGAAAVLPSRRELESRSARGRLNLRK